MSEKIRASSTLPEIPISADLSALETELPSSCPSPVISPENLDFHSGMNDWWRYRSDPKIRLGVFELKTYNFKPDNPIHKMMEIFSEFFAPETIRWAYEEIGRILQEVKKRLRPDMSSEEKLSCVYEVLEDLDYKLISLGHPLLLSDLKNKKLDCDTSAFLVCFVGFELNWPVFPILIPHHLYLRWEEPGKSFNIDRGKILPDSVYQNNPHAPHFFCDSSIPTRSCYHRLKPQEWAFISLILRNQKYESQKNIEKLLQLRSIPLDSASAPLLFTVLSQSSTFRGENSEAVFFSSQNIASYPRYSQEYFRRGIAHQNLKNLQQARADYLKAIDLDEELRSHLLVKIDILKSGGNTESASFWQEKVRSLEQQMGRVLTKLGLVEDFSGSHSEAQKDFNLAVQFYPEFARVHRGDFYLNHSQKEKALEDYLKVFKSSSCDPESLKKIAEGFDKLGKYDLALLAYTRLIHLENNLNSELLLLRAMLCEKLGKHDEAWRDRLEAYNLQLDRNPSDASLQLGLAKALYELDEPLSSIEAATTALILGMEEAQIYWVRGLAYQKLGRNREANADRMRAAELNDYFKMKISQKPVI